MTQVALINPTTVDDNLATACRVCGRKLTSLESRKAGIGPVCAEILASAEEAYEETRMTADDVREAAKWYMRHRVLRYRGKFGALTVDLRRHTVDDDLDHDAIVEDNPGGIEGYRANYGDILETLLGDLCCFVEFDMTDFGFRCVLPDGYTLRLDWQGVYLTEPW